MKKIFSKLIFASAALLAAFVSCQKVEEISEAPKTTHIVRFTTEMPTKTSYVVEGNSVKYSWEENDIANLKVFEDGTQGEITNHAITDGVLSLEVSFESQEGPHTYTAYLNGAVKSEQVETITGSYDPTCDVLVAKPIKSSELGEGGVYTFCFRRPVAITELKLKNLTVGEKVSKVTIISDSEHPIAGKYTQDSEDDSKGEWSEFSNKIVVTFSEAKTVGSDGILPLSIVTRPIKEASVKVLVETESGLKYRKITDPALSLLADKVKAQGIGLTSVTEAEHAEDGWYLVTDASELFDGDEIRIASPANSAIAGALGGEKYLAKNNASFTPETYNQLTGTDSENAPETFTLVEKYSAPNGVLAFELVSSNGKLGTTAVKTMSYDDGLTEYKGVTEWTIAIDNKLASIGAGSYGRIQYNVTSPRFVNYTSDPQSNQVLPWIYKKYGDASEPILKKTRTASFSPETATVTIGANNNVFPTLSFEPAEPAEATEGAQTWTSSNTDVATVNATTGEVTLVSDGTTTISVEIAETDTYQPCSAEYALTVKPAPVQGLDIIDNDFAGNPNKYSDWSNTSDGSGKTYAGYSTTQSNKNNMQFKSNDSVSGIVVTASTTGKVAAKITVEWDTETASGRTLDVYGKTSAYSAVSELYSSKSDEQGTMLGSITYGTSTELVIDGSYEYIGLRSKSGAQYIVSITIQWKDDLPEYKACFKNGDAAVEEVNGTVGVDFTAPTLSIDDGLTPSVTYGSSDTDVATVDAESGAVTLKKKGDAIITATLNGDETHKTTKVSYTLHVANKLSSIKLAKDSEQLTTFYVGQDFSFTGIKLEAEYNDGEKKTLTADDLTAENFSGFDSSTAVESQTITVSYTDGATETTTYDIEIKPSVTLYGITVPAADANGNSITVKGGLTEAPEGDEIELNVNLNTEKGYKLTSLKVNDVEHSTDVAEGKYTFTMPAAAVTVTAEFDNHYTVTLTPPAANGTVKVKGETTSSQSIACGETVSVLAEPETGYELDSWTINGAELADATKASTSFTMPANDVTITASFKKHIETQKITLTASDVTNFASKYADYNWTADGVSGTMRAYRGGSSGSYNLQFNEKTQVHNTTAVPGRIKSITMTKVSGTTRTWSVYVGATALTSTTGATQVESAKEVSSETKWTVTSGDYYYFYLTKADGGTNIGSIVIEYEPGVVPAVDASWKVDPISVKAGADKDATIDTNYDGTLSVSSNNTGIATATISGKTITVHGVAEGNTTLTVTGAATTAFNAINKTIDVTVNPAGGSDPVTVTWVAQNASDNPGDAKDWFSGSIDANISWAATKGGSNNPKYYNTGTGLRVYNGGTFTVSAANGKKITKIILTFSGASYTFSSSNATTPQTYDLSSVESKQWEVSRTCRLQKVEVTYE